jgi:hypothetical protein
MRSNFASSVRWDDSAKKTSKARTLELGREELRILAVTKAKMIRAGPSSAARGPDCKAPRSFESRFGICSSTGMMSYSGIRPKITCTEMPDLERLRHARCRIILNLHIHDGVFYSIRDEIGLDALVVRPDPLHPVIGVAGKHVRWRVCTRKRAGIQRAGSES